MREKSEFIVEMSGREHPDQVRRLNHRELWRASCLKDAVNRLKANNRFGGVILSTGRASAAKKYFFSILGTSFCFYQARHHEVTARSSNLVLAQHSRNLREPRNGCSELFRRVLRSLPLGVLVVLVPHRRLLLVALSAQSLSSR